jgi:DNA-binding NarL/FixJ family response regulator
MLKILIVEDNLKLRTALKSGLEATGEVEVMFDCAGGEEAVDYPLDDTAIDAVLMDVQLAGEMNGIQAAAKIAEQSDVPIIFMTCLSDQKIFERALQTHPYGYIIKPYEINELRSAIEIAMVKHDAAMEREALIVQLQDAQREVKTLSGLLPICASCKRIRNDDNSSWQAIEAYIASHSEADFTHGICPDCVRRLYPDYYKDRK